MTIKVSIPLDNIINNVTGFYPANWYPTVIRPIHPRTYRSLGSAALDITPVSVSSFSVTYDSPINYVMSDDIIFPYNYTPIGPLITNDYDTVDDDLEMRSKITKYFYEQLFNKWLMYENDKILRFFKVKNNKINKIKSKSEYEKNKITDTEQKKKIIQFILDNIYDKYDLKFSLRKFIKKTGTKWFELKDNDVFVKEQIVKDIKRKIRDSY